MKLVKREGKAREPSRFSGRVKVVVSGFDQHSVLMSKRSGLAARGFVVSDTTLDEVFNIVRKAVEERCEEGEV